MTDFVFEGNIPTEENVVDERIESVKNQSKSNKQKVKEIQEAIGYDEEEGKDPAFEALLAEKREQRKNFNEDMESPLAYLKPYLDKDPRFEYHFFNDKPGRIKAKQARGWDFVYDEELAALTGQEDKKAPIQIPTGLHDSAEPTMAYLMKLPKVLFEEDKKRKLQINQEKMDSIHNIERDERFQDKDKNYQIKIDG